ncbi:S-layer homology domain-containing protein [Bifidobacterium miconisargentati]|uniref:S-layer homology domain-containing protein n=1 Tax=Bifidobacterium miconisargentati TaxID=2834437 RepID=UPI001BDC57AA|nr:S-layer homology domain-containing protein [Bifidobacterium miconisargentati]MBW3091144.1 S-layer homology domain-containing protein [Bifidobacterium miconisargentati]
MTGNNKVWRAPLAGLAAVAMLATMGVAASTAGAVDFPDDAQLGSPTYEITFNLNGRGEWTDKEFASNPVEKLDSGDDYEFTAAEQTAVQGKIKSGSFGDFVFAGWWTSPTTGQGEQIDPTAAVTKDITLYAHWAKASDMKTVTFNAGAVATTLSGQSFTLASGDKLSSWQKPEDSAVDGKILSGWAKDFQSGEAVDLDAAVTEDLNLVPTYTTAHVVKYVGLESYKFVNGTKWQYEVADGGTAPTPFVVDEASKTAITGWDVKDSEGKTASLTNVKDDLTVTDTPGATAPAYKVSFAVSDLAGQDGQALTNQYAFDAPADQWVIKNGTVSLPADDVNLYDGLYKIASWKYRNPSNSAAYVSYASQKVQDIAQADGTVTLHAVLKLAKTPTVQYTITFDPDYTGSVPSTVKVNKDEKIVAPAAPTRSGYTFLGWFLKGTTTQLNVNDKATADATYVAHWQKTNQYELDNLLGLTNKDELYTKNSFDKYEAVRSKLAKDSEGRISGPGVDGKYSANYADATLTDDVIAEYTKTLSDAAKDLVYTADTLNMFKDVDENSVFNTYIWSLAKKGVIKGYADNTFRGTDKILRQDFAAFLYRLAGEPEYTVNAADNKFSDVNESTPHYKAILWATKQGIIKGYADGTFRGTATVLRQDASAFLYRLAGSPSFDENSVAKFTDVTSTTPHAKAVLWAADNGIVRGFTDGTFKGTNEIIRQDAAAFLYRLDGTVNIPALYK